VQNSQGGVHLGVGTAAMIAVAFGAAAFTDHGTVQRLLVMALAVGLGAALISDWRYSAGLGVIGYLLYVGFLANSYGELAWQGDSALWDVGIFALAYFFGAGQRRLRAEVAPEPDQPRGDEPEITASSR
jgi:hypothetical protein